MMKNFNYSIIIPHHNCPHLLLRLISSIPQRDDIQIIVVDDASDSEIVNWDTFKFDPAKNIELYLISKAQSKWAGHARNIGLEHAEGRWLLFADSDDYFRDGAFDVLDKYVHGDDDIIYYNCGSVDSDTLQPADRADSLNNYIERYFQRPSPKTLDTIKYRVHAPWNKMVKHSLVKNHSISFEEVIKGNDIQYTILVGYFAKAVRVIQDDIYICTQRRGNMTFGKQSEAVRLRILQSHFVMNAFYDFIGRKEWKKSPIQFYSKFVAKSFAKLGWSKAIPFLIKSLGYKNMKFMYSQRNNYVNLLTNKRDTI